MSIQNIKFKKIKKVHNQYIERAHINNTIIQFNINDLSIEKTLYKKNKKIFLDVSMEKINPRIRRLNKLKTYTINKVAEQHKKSFEVMEKNYINKYRETEDLIIFPLEIHPECNFFKINHFDKQSEDSYKNLTIGDNVDLLVSFKGILYGKSNFTNKYVIHKVIRHENEELNLEGCYIEDSDIEDEDNQEVYVKKLKNRFGELYEEKENVSVEKIKIKPEENVSVAKIEIKPEENVSVATIEIKPEENISVATIEIKPEENIE